MEVEVRRGVPRQSDRDAAGCHLLSLEVECRRIAEAAGLDYLLCAPLSHESFVMLTDQVLPRLG